MCSYEHYWLQMTPRAIQELLEELEASRASRKRAWEILQELRWVLKSIAGIDPPVSGKKTIDAEGRVVKEAIRKALKDHQGALTDLIHAVREYRKLADKPLTLQGSEYAHAIQELKKAVDRAEELLQ